MCHQRIKGQLGSCNNIEIMENNKFNGSHAVIESLIAEGVDTVFGYPGGTIMPVYDALYDYMDKIKHYLVRHEQGATHAAEGYARASGKIGVCIVTSGPGATNTITGIADAMMDSTPLVVISGQVGSSFLGTDAFQETHFTCITQPITKWNILVKNASEIPDAIAKGFYIAKNGRPGPVVIDITKSAQMEPLNEFKYTKVEYLRSYKPYPTLNIDQIDSSVKLLNSCERPMVIIGQGIQISGAEEELKEFLNKTNFPVTSSLLGLSSIPTNHKNFVGMAGMHGYYAPNMNMNKSDLILAIGVRFDDRLTSNAELFATNPKIIHIDIDASEIGKIIDIDIEVIGDAKQCLNEINKRIDNWASDEWIDKFKKYREMEQEKVINNDLNPIDNQLKMPEIIHKVTMAYNSEAIVITDVGQQQMFAARYANMSNSRSFISSGGLGTMGFGLPASIGAKVAMKNRDVVLFVGDGGIQMNIQELATIMQYEIDVKIVILNNSFLGMVRQWQELFFDSRYSFTEMTNPDFSFIAKAHNISYSKVENRDKLDEEIEKMKQHKGAYILEAIVMKEYNVFPIVPAGASLEQVRLK